MIKTIRVSGAFVGRKAPGAGGERQEGDGGGFLGRLSRTQ
jgi:hypothetical protein